jgi:hypothetical protein
LGLLPVLSVVFLPSKPLGRQTTTQRLAAEGAGDTGRVEGVDGFDRDSEAGVTQSSGDGDAAVPPPGGDEHPGAGPGAGAGRTGERLVRIVTVERPADPVEAGTR